MTPILGALSAGGPLVSLPASGQLAASSVNVSPTNAVAGFRFDNDGNIYETPINSSTVTFNVNIWRWLLKGAAGDYEVRVSEDGPDSWIGAGAGAWHNLGTDRDFYAQRTTIGTHDANGTFEIRLASSGVVLATSAGGQAGAEESA